MMVFRNADATLVAKTKENADIVIPISDFKPPYIVMPEGIGGNLFGKLHKSYR